MIKTQSWSLQINSDNILMLECVQGPCLRMMFTKFVSLLQICINALGVGKKKYFLGGLADKSECLPVSEARWLPHEFSSWSLGQR